MNNKLTSSEKILQTVLSALEDAKAQHVISLDVRDMTDITDYMVIASGTSSRHVKSVADKVADSLRDAGNKALGTEGENEGEWVLVDFGDVILHVMQHATREHYQLEKLWEYGAAVKKISLPAES